MVKPRIAILICTFQRESLAKCMDSILQQSFLKEVEAQIIVADNSEDKFASKCVVNAERHSDVPIRYIHAPHQNISVARNACLDAADTDWIVFIDDDEHAPQDWLKHLWQDVIGRDVVFGDVIAQYPATTPKWITQRDYHSTMISPKQRLINTGYAGNVMIRWKGTAWFNQRFDLRLGRTGGEDTVFFNALFHRGAQMGRSKRGFIWEPVPENRLTLRWLIHRRFRSGQSYGDIAPQTTPRWTVFYTAALKSLFSLFCAVVLVWYPTQGAFWFLRSVFHLGVLSHSIKKPIPKLTNRSLS